MSAIEPQNVSKAWGRTIAVRDVSFTVDEGRFLVLPGPSGCGKSTTLCMIAGLQDATATCFEFPGRDVAFALVLVQLMIMPEMPIVGNYRTMGPPRPGRHHPRHRPALHGQRLRHLPAAPDLQDHPAGAGGGGPRRGLLAPADPVEDLRAAGQAHLHRLRSGLGQLPLEQLPVAAGHHHLGHHPPADRRARHLRGAGIK